MAKRVLDWKLQRFTGLTGSSTVNFDPFDFSTYGVTNSVRSVIDVDCVALDGSGGPAYSCQYLAKIVYHWNISGFSGTIIKSVVHANDTASQITWGASNAGGAGTLRLSATGQATTNVWTIVMAARIVNFVEY